MSKSVAEWFLNAPQNDFATDDGGMPEGQTRSSVNNSVREQMRAIRQWYDTDMEWLDLMRNPADGLKFATAKLSDTEIEITSGANDMESYFNVGRPIQTLTAGVVTDSPLFVVSVNHVNPTTTVTIADGTVTDGIDEVLLHAGADLGRLAFEDAVLSDFIVPAGFTDADFADALTLASAAGGGTILLQVGIYQLDTQHIIPTKTTILGLSQKGSVINVITDSNLDSLFLIPVTSEGVSFESFTVSGGSQSAGRGDIFEVSGSFGVRFVDLSITSVRGSAMFVAESGAQPFIDIVIDRCLITSTGDHAIYFLDGLGTSVGCSITNTTITSPGTTAGGAGIFVTGPIKMSGIVVAALNGGGGITQVGVQFRDKQAANPNEDDAHDASLVGFYITGVGQNAKGIELGGRRCNVGNGSIVLSGSVSRGIDIDGPSGQKSPEHNTVTGVTISDSQVGILVGGASTHNVLSGITTKDCANDALVDGDYNILTGWVCEAATVDGVSLRTGARLNRVDNMTFVSTAGVAVDVQAGAEDNWVADNAYDLVGTEMIDAGDGTRPKDYVYHNEVADTVNSASELGVSGMSGIPFPGLVPDGNHQWKVTFTAQVTPLGDLPNAVLRMGTSGTPSDAVILNSYVNAHSAPPSSFQSNQETSHGIVTPGVGDVLTATKKNTGAFTSNMYYWLTIEHVRGT